MRVSPILKRSDFTADRIKERLAISPLIIGYNQSSEEEEWWHDVVVYGARTDSSGKTSYAIMDPGPSRRSGQLGASAASCRFGPREARRGGRELLLSEERKRRLGHRMEQEVAKTMNRD